MVTDTNQSTGELALHVLTKLLVRVEKLRKKLAADPNDDHLHQIRIYLRKIRAALALFEPFVIVSKEVTNKKIGAIARAFGKKRDYDVLVEKFKQFTQDIESEPVKKAKKRFHKQGKKLSNDIKEVLKSKTFENILEELDSWVQAPQFTIRAAEHAATSIGEILLSAIAGIKMHTAWALIATLDLENDIVTLFEEEAGNTMHDLRKSAKELRYQIEFVEHIANNRFLEYRDLLKTLQDRLGIVQDMRLLKTFFDKTLDKKWREELPGIRQNIEATIRSNIFEAKKMAPQLQSIF